MIYFKNFLRFPGFKRRAVTLSYDDGRNYDERLISIMRKYGLKGTFNLNSTHLVKSDAGFLSVDDVKRIFGDDTEIALHGYHHLSLASVPKAQACNDVVSDRIYLESTFERIVRGMAYANGSYDDGVIEMLKDAGVAYSRTVKATEAFSFPEEWCAWHPTCHHSNPRLFELVDEFLNYEHCDAHPWRAKNVPLLFYLWGHSYEFPRDNNWDLIERFGEKMASRNDIWFATNMEIYEYVEAYNSLIFSSDTSYVKNPTGMDIYIGVGEKELVVKPNETVQLKLF